MAVSSLVAPSAASKTAYRTTLTSGTSWTVPAGVTYVNVTLTGGGGGGGAGAYSSGQYGSAGGTTTFTGATSATGGNGGRYSNTSNSSAGTSAQSNSGLAGGGSFRDNGGPTYGEFGHNGTVISSIVSTTPGATITYAIGAGGAGGTGSHDAGGTGGSGKIDIEYWV